MAPTGPTSEPAPPRGSPSIDRAAGQVRPATGAGGVAERGEVDASRPDGSRAASAEEPARLGEQDGAGSVAVVVVTHQSASTIGDCLDRLLAAPEVGAIRVVDNASTDDTLALVRARAQHAPRLQWLANPDNPGFGAACNQGAAGLAQPWLALVNPDCLLEPGTLERLRVLGAPLGDVLVGADLVGQDGTRDGSARRNDPDFAAMLGELVRGRGARAPHIEPDDTRTLQPVQAISGAVMLMPRTLFERLGGFDTGYRLHAEDLDLCRRARIAGAAVVVANAVTVLHLRGVSSRSRPLFVEWHKHRGLWRYYRKFDAPRRGAVMAAAVFAAIWLRFPLAAARARWRSRRFPAPL